MVVVVVVWFENEGENIDIWLQLNSFFVACLFK